MSISENTKIDLHRDMLQTSKDNNIDKDVGDLFYNSAIHSLKTKHIFDNLPV